MTTTIIARFNLTFIIYSPLFNGFLIGMIFNSSIFGDGDALTIIKLNLYGYSYYSFPVSNIIS